MRVAPIASPLPGEHVAATSPKMSETGSSAGWRLRVNFWAGRSLTADALEREQSNRAGRLAWHGRAATAGVVSGLEVALEPPATPQETLTRTGYFVHVLPGHGLRADGEDIVVPRPLRVALDEIPIVYVRVSGPDREEAPEAAPEGATAGDPIDAGGFAINIDTFPYDYQPWAAVLVLRPSEFRTFRGLDATDPCELDPSFDPFIDERRVDASALRLCQLPAGWQSLPELSDPGNVSWRNRLADVIFSEETRLSARHQIRFRVTRSEEDHWDTVLREANLFPWEFLGVPLALLSSENVTADASVYFLDRASVVRPGGNARTRTRPAIRLATGDSDADLNPPGAGTPYTWRARVDQFAEHMGLFSTATREDIEQLRDRFPFVPPVGFLPRATLELLTTAQASALPLPPNQTPDRAGIQHFFPTAYDVEVVPVAIEDLDAALAASAPLEPYDLLGMRRAVIGGEPARILVPLPQRVFDPRLLVVEIEDPIFAQTVARFVATRQDWRQRRDFVRARVVAIAAASTGPQPTAATPLEAGQLETEPTEPVGGLGFTAALVSPLATAPPWEAHLDFNTGHAFAADTQMFLLMRVDEDATPTHVTGRWQTDAGELSFTWTDIPAAPLEQLDAQGNPLPTPLWRRFIVTGTQLGATAGASTTGVTVHLDDGRVAIAVAGRQPATGSDLADEIWWRSQDAAHPPVFVGGDWTRVTGDQLAAPFEDPYVPIFPDGRSQADRIADVETALNPPNITARAVPLSVATDGLERVLAEMENEANEADDFVDAHFTRAQTNLYRIRKLILGETAAQKLLINPAIATIAEQETATATAEQLGSFLTAAKQRPAPAVQVNAALGFAPPAVHAFAGLTASVSPNLFLGGALPVFRAGNFEQVDTSPIVAKATTRADALSNVIGERPESGPTLPPRGLTIGQRFVEPKATQNLSYARAALAQFLSQLTRLRLPLVDLTVRSVTGSDDVSLIELQGRALPPAQATDPPTTSETIRRAAVDKLLSVTQVANDTDEAEVTLAALDFTEVQSAILRTIEKATQQRRAVIATGSETLTIINATRDAAAGRVLAIEGKLAEARQDVSVARALRREEQQRLADINDRRDALIRDQVKFLAYVRPRAVDIVERAVQYWQLDPFEALAPVPACLQRHDEPAPPLNTYLQLMRHAPARWFSALAPLLARLDTADKLIALLDSARVSALSFSAFDAVSSIRGTAEAVQFTVLGAHQTIGLLRQQSATLDIGDKRAKRWTDFQRDAAQHTAIGDLIDGKHGSRDVSTAAAGELEQIGEVATCLHAEFAASPPALRLAWIERFSQFDQPGLLRDLTVLPQFGRLDRDARRRLQAFVDWLFGRLATTEGDAVNLINDLVRLCLLLASHAPVNRIIAGHVPRPTPVRPGIQIPIRPINPDLVRVGMEFHVWQGSRRVASGLVEDLQNTEVTARVDVVDAQTTTIDTSMRVQFLPAALGIRR
jgi:hypothetical protein